MSWRALAFLALSALPSRAAGRAESPSVRVASAAVKGVERAGLSGCRKSPERVWSLVKAGFAQVFPKLLLEIEGAMPGRFFPDAEAMAERRLTQDGHFTRVLCRGAGGMTACPEKRGALEARVLEASLLRSLPVEHSYEALYDPETWEVTGLGRSVLDEARRCWPDLKPRTAAMAVLALGR